MTIGTVHEELLRANFDGPMTRLAAIMETYALHSRDPLRWTNGRLRAQIGFSRKAFTLMELLVAIGIIAILLAILIPVISKVAAHSRRITCLSNVSQLGKALFMYTDANNGALPASAFDRPTPGSGFPTEFFSEDWIHWQSASGRKLENSALAPYLGAEGAELKRVLRCPDDDLERTARDRGAGRDGKYEYSYGINYCVSFSFSLSKGKKFTQFKNSSSKILFTEPLILRGGTWYPSYRLTMRHGKAPKTAFPQSGYAVGTPGGIDVSTVFVDGHAEPITQDFADDLNHSYWDR